MWRRMDFWRNASKHTICTFMHFGLIFIREIFTILVAVRNALLKLMSKMRNESSKKLIGFIHSTPYRLITSAHSAALCTIVYFLYATHFRCKEKMIKESNNGHDLFRRFICLKDLSLFFLLEKLIEIIYEHVVWTIIAMIKSNRFLLFKKKIKCMHKIICFK